MKRTSGLRGALRGTALGLGLVAGLWSAAADAQSLADAMAQAYYNNPTLNAQRAQLRAQDELLPQAYSNYRPFVTLDGNVGVQGTDTNVSDWDSNIPGGAGLSVVQPLYRGGRSDAEVGRANNLIQSQRAVLFDTEQLVLLDAVTVYTNVVRDVAVLDLAQNNEEVIGRQLEATRDRFEVGEVTRTDVAQAEARLATAKADRVRAEGNLVSSKASFRRVIGVEAVALERPQPLTDMPVNEIEAFRIAEAEHPAIIAAKFAEQAARDDVRITEGTLLPEINLRGTVERSYDEFGLADRQDIASLRAEISIPIYTAGLNTSLVRQDKQIAGQRRIEIDEQRRRVIEGVTLAWEDYLTAQAQIEAFREGVRAAEIALEGLQKEALVGARTVLDVLDGEQELFQARVDLVVAQRDLVVATYALQAALGRLSAKHLALPVEPYDFEAYYETVREKWSGTEVPAVEPGLAAAE